MKKIRKDVGSGFNDLIKILEEEFDYNPTNLTENKVYFKDYKKGEKEGDSK